MTEYTDSLEEFKHAEEICNKLVEVDRTIPSMVFKTDFDFYCFAEDCALFNSRGTHWEHILMLARKPNIGRLVFMVLDPDPKSYYSWCNRYGTILIDPRIEKEDIYKIFSESPKEGTCDTIYVVAQRFVIFSEYSPNWCLWTDRYYEIAILAINDCPERQVIQETIGDVWLSTEEAIYELLPLNCFPKPIPEHFRQKLLANYGGYTTYE